MSPAGSFTFGSDTDFGAFLCVQEVESQAAQDGQVVLTMALTDATVVLTKGDIQDPVDCVFDASVAAGGVTCQVTKLLINDEELSHHAQVFVIKDVAVEHIWSVFSGIRVESGDDNDIAFFIHQHGVFPS